jgi:hypothetical protein
MLDDIERRLAEERAEVELEMKQQPEEEGGGLTIEERLASIRQRLETELRGPEIPPLPETLPSSSERTSPVPHRVERHPAASPGENEGVYRRGVEWERRRRERLEEAQRRQRDREMSEATGKPNTLRNRSRSGGFVPAREEPQGTRTTEEAESKVNDGPSRGVDVSERLLSIGQSYEERRQRLSEELARDMPFRPAITGKAARLQRPGNTTDRLYREGMEQLGRRRHQDATAALAEEQKAETVDRHSTFGASMATVASTPRPLSLNEAEASGARLHADAERRRQLDYLRQAAEDEEATRRAKPMLNRHSLELASARRRPLYTPPPKAAVSTIGSRRAGGMGVGFGSSVPRDSLPVSPHTVAARVMSRSAKQPDPEPAPPEDTHSFTPALCRKSTDMVEHSPGREGGVVDRLYRRAVEHQRDAERHLEAERKARELEGCTFVPNAPPGTAATTDTPRSRDPVAEERRGRSIYERQLRWMQAREERLMATRLSKAEDDLVGCTFRPETRRSRRASLSDLPARDQGAFSDHTSRQILDSGKEAPVVAPAVVDRSGRALHGAPLLATAARGNSDQVRLRARETRRRNSVASVSTTLASQSGVLNHVMRQERGRRLEHERHTPWFATGMRWTPDVTKPQEFRLGMGAKLNRVRARYEAVSNYSSAVSSRVQQTDPAASDVAAAPKSFSTHIVSSLVRPVTAENSPTRARLSIHRARVEPGMDAVDAEDVAASLWQEEFRHRGGLGASVLNARVRELGVSTEAVSPSVPLSPGASGPLPGRAPRIVDGGGSYASRLRTRHR